MAAGLALLVSVMVLGDDTLKVGVVLAVPLAILTSKLAGLYDRDDNRLARRTLEEGPVLFAFATGYTLLVVLLEPYALEGRGLGRDQLLGLWLAFFFGLLTMRALARGVGRMLAPAERCLALGDVPALARIERSLTADGQVDAEVVAKVDLEADEQYNRPWPAPADLQWLAALVREQDVDRVIVAPRTADAEDMLDLIRAVKALGVKVSIVPRLFEVVGSSVEFDDVHGLTLLGVRDFGLTRSSRAVKRTFDLVASGLLLVCVAPLLAAIAVLIKLDSPGPVFFRQPRVGRAGEVFELLKFRSMCEEADSLKQSLRAWNDTEGLFKMADDPRVTRLGRVLRRTSMDELPQLLNVLRGEMSVVGPRPLVLDDDRQIVGWGRRRLYLTPGMTGPWQVLGAARVPLREMVTIDYIYAANWSLWSDVKIVLRTVLHVLGGRGL